MGVRSADALRANISLLSVVAGGLCSAAAQARPNTHAPAVSTFDARASSVSLALGRGISGSGDFTRLSYSANFSSTSGVLSAQFGVHYLTYRDSQESVLARGFSAGGVALFNFPIAERFANGVPRSSFDFYLGGVPTALFSGQLNFISVPMVIGVAVPLSPAPWLSFEPWAELSPGINFDTRIQAVSTAAAVQSAMDGTLTRDEVEDLVDEGLKISQKTTLGKRAGVSVSAHLGERADLGVHFALGGGHSGALSVAAGVVVRWDVMVEGVRTEPERRGFEARVPPACTAWQTGLQRCVAAAPPRPVAAPPATRAPRAPAAPATAPARTRAGTRRAAPAPAATSAAPVPRMLPPRAPAPRAPAPAIAPAAAVAPAPAAGTAQRKKAAPPLAPAPALPGTQPKPASDALPPLQAAPPRPR